MQKQLKTKDRLKIIINSPGYKNLSDYNKKETLDRVLKASQSKARDILFSTNKRLQKEYIELEQKQFRE